MMVEFSKKLGKKANHIKALKITWPDSKWHVMHTICIYQRILYLDTEAFQNKLFCTKLGRKVGFLLDDD